MITLVGMIETDWDITWQFGIKSSPEFLGWRQLAGAYNVQLNLVGHKFDTLEEALVASVGHRIFFIPPGRTESIDFKDFTPPEGDIVYVFGNTAEDLVSYIQEGDTVVSIHTPHQSDLMAISVVGIVLNEYR